MLASLWERWEPQQSLSRGERGVNLYFPGSLWLFLGVGEQRPKPQWGSYYKNQARPERAAKERRFLDPQASLLQERGETWVPCLGPDTFETLTGPALSIPMATHLTCTPTLHAGTHLPCPQVCTHKSLPCSHSHMLQTQTMLLGIWEDSWAPGSLPKYQSLSNPLSLLKVCREEGTYPRSPRQRGPNQQSTQPGATGDLPKGHLSPGIN
jgi:hypothetical protein